MAKNDLMQRLSAKKVGTQEEQVLFQFRFPKAYAEKFKAALEKQGLKPRDLVEAAIDTFLENTGTATEDRSNAAKAKNILGRGGRGADKN
jgi:hypothetical protein